eukprot:3535227-Alexandrium_andersonii.AAC.1
MRGVNEGAPSLPQHEPHMALHGRASQVSACGWMPRPGARSRRGTRLTGCSQVSRQPRANATRCSVTVGGSP